ncbi:hypothetical protein [Cupriavidus pauculus]|uniref:hypothetical protein n=1 Tax=Cupriavidus pauculus TaxID=82633 RepID=UPI001EE249AD|nr:hypothetical protein [Cupriavidus pauculus]GJG96805.1 hypothetical protein CBA19C6_19970 [Cupriavidus pauculus]
MWNGKGIAVIAALIVVSDLAWADMPDSPAKPTCVDVEVNGERAPSYACLTQQLAPAHSATTEQRQLGSESIANRPSNQLGLYNRAATEHRMGNTFGSSVLPQRPVDNK